MKNLFLTLFIVVGFATEAQAQLDAYKYVVVPKKFDGFKRENQYKSSTLLKHLFTEKGFLTVYDDELPEELKNQSCLGLTLNMVNNSSMFTTKTTLVLEDCSKQEVFASAVGTSKEKQYQAAFSEAIRDAFQSFNALDYTYAPKQQDVPIEQVTVSFKNDVKKLEEQTSRKGNGDAMVEEVVAKGKEASKKPVAPTAEMIKEPAQAIVMQVATEDEQSFETIAPVVVPSSRVKTASTVLYAQELNNGYQLVDSTPKIRMKLLKSSAPDFYIAESDMKNGMVYTKNNKWYFEYYEAGELVTEELNIKF